MDIESGRSATGKNIFYVYYTYTRIWQSNYFLKNGNNWLRIVVLGYEQLEEECSSFEEYRDKKVTTEEN